jgi:DNA-binding XRE family transcriptional regulator
MSASSSAKAEMVEEPMMERRVSMATNIQTEFVRRNEFVRKNTAWVTGHGIPTKLVDMTRGPTPSENAERAALRERIQAARVAAGYETATELAAVLGISQQRYNNWDNGLFLPNEVGLLRRLCDALDVTADFLLLGRTTGLSRTTYAKISRLMEL